MGFAVARAAGYSAQAILNMLVRTYPQMSQYIQMAATAGYSADQIAKFVERSGLQNMKKFQKGIYNNSLKPYADEDTNPYIQRDINIKKTAEIPQVVKTLGKSGLSALGGYALSRAAPYLANAFTNNTNSENSDPQNPQPENFDPENLNPQNPDLQNLNLKNLQPENQNNYFSQINASKLFDEMDLSKQILQIGSTNTPENVANVLEQHILTDAQKKWLKQQTKEPLSNLINRFLSENKQKEQEITQETQPDVNAERNKIEPEINQEITQETQEKSEKPPNINNEINKIEPKKEQEIKPKTELETKPKTETEFQKPKKQKSVLTPQGDLGTITDVKNGIAKIDVNGVEKTRKIEDLEESPIDADQLADLYTQLKDTIEEKDRSSVLNWSGYDAKTNKLAWRPHDGRLYIIENVPPEFAEKLKNAMFKAKTTGENFYGAWKEGEDSRFAGINQLLKKLIEKFGPGKEYSERYDTIYDFFAPAEKAVKMKNKKNKPSKSPKPKKTK